MFRYFPSHVENLTNTTTTTATKNCKLIQLRLKATKSILNWLNIKLNCFVWHYDSLTEIKFEETSVRHAHMCSASINLKAIENYYMIKFNSLTGVTQWLTCIQKEENP